MSGMDIVLGRGLLVARLGWADVRRHRAQAAMLVLSITVATAMLSLGGALHGASDRLYRQTRAATTGPDLVAVTPGSSPAVTRFLTSLETYPGVVAHAGPYRHYFTTLTVHGSAVTAVVREADAAPAPVDRPRVTAGTWVRPGAVVVERGFASALGVHIGDQIAVAGQPRTVTGIAVSAAYTIYPSAQMGGAGGGPRDHAGLVWMSRADTRTLHSPDVTSLLYLKLRDPDETAAFVDSTRPSRRRGAITVNLFTWQFIAHQDSTRIEDNQVILMAGGWLLAFLAVVGVSALAAGRAARQTRRVGLLRAVGASTSLIAAVLLSETLVLALVADVLGLIAARVAAVPALVNPSGSLIATSSGPSGRVIIATTVFALVVALVTTLASTVPALRTDAVTALSDTVHRPRRRVRLSRVSTALPTALLLGLRLTGRRPGRALLQAISTCATVSVGVVLLMVYAQPRQRWYFGAVTMADFTDVQMRRVLLSVTAALITLALVNTVTITWTTALEARATMAIARTLGATPGQITAGLSLAQLLPTLPGALAGVPIGLLLYLPFAHDQTSMAPFGWLVSAVLVPVAATAALTAVPARAAARRSIADTLSAETA
jgi:putative ABC transport system permease protein